MQSYVILHISLYKLKKKKEERERKKFKLIEALVWNTFCEHVCLSFHCTAISSSFKNLLIYPYRAIIFLLFVDSKLSMSINEHYPLRTYI